MGIRIPSTLFSLQFPYHKWVLTGGGRGDINSLILKKETGGFGGALLHTGLHAFF
jgi:hypothetical protein